MLLGSILVLYGVARSGPARRGPVWLGAAGQGASALRWLFLLVEIGEKCINHTSLK